MAWFIPAIMAVGKGAAAAGQAVAHGAEAAGEGVGHGAEAAGQKSAKELRLSDQNLELVGGGESAGASMPAGGAAAGNGTPSAAMPAAGSVQHEGSIDDG